MSSFGQRLAAYRKQRGWTQFDLAAEAEVYWQSVGSWERDEKLPRLDTLMKVVTALDIRVEDLWVGEP